MKPTAQSYGSLQEAYEWFNAELFGGQLPECLITFQRHKGAYGYFAGKRFKGDGAEVDEIALNPQHFERGAEKVLSTLVHEMVHLWQAHFGKEPRRCYHDRQWAAKMEEVGLVPSHTGEPGGKKTGQRMTHYIAPGGPYQRAVKELLGRRPAVLFQDQWGASSQSAAKKNESKTKFSCPSCELNAWAKPSASLVCGQCGCELEAA